MNPIDMLESVLCGPDGKCCLAGSDTDRAIVDAALTALRAAAQPVEAANGWEKGLDIRMSQGWKLKGGICPVLYSDTVNGYGVGRDDLWLATTDALKSAQPVEVQPLTNAQVSEGQDSNGLFPGSVASCAFTMGVRFAESKHGIKPTSSEKDVISTNKIELTLAEFEDCVNHSHGNTEFMRQKALWKNIEKALSMKIIE